MPNQMRFRPPMQPMAQNLASRGRYGDSMLVHMNPAEVKGLAALSPTGSLTRNPDTGQPEAFLPLSLGLLGSGLGSAGLLGGNALLLGALGSGLGTWAETGDLGEGIQAGLMGAMMGKLTGTFLKGMVPDPSAAGTVAAGTTPAGTTAAGTTGSLIDQAAQYDYASGIGTSPFAQPYPKGIFAQNQAINTAVAQQAQAAPGVFGQLGQSFNIDPTGQTAAGLSGLDTSLASAMNPEGIIATALVPGMTGAGMAWEPDPIGDMMDDDDEDWGEGFLMDRGFQAPPQGYTAGIGPEWNYYKNPFEVDIRPRRFKRGGLAAAIPDRGQYMGRAY